MTQAPALDLADYPGYRVTLDGRVLSVKRGAPRELRARQHHRTGHLRVRLYGDHLDRRECGGAHANGTRKATGFVDVYVHVLVCTAWHGPPPSPDAMVLHLDDDPEHNHAANLRWGTASENRQHQLVPNDEQAEAARRERLSWWASAVQAGQVPAPAAADVLGLDSQGWSWVLGCQVA